MDWTAPGLYEDMVPADMDDMTAAACALGGFHFTVPIKCLYMFKFRVYDGCGNYELEPGHDQDWYLSDDFKHYGTASSTRPPTGFSSTVPSCCRTTSQS